MHRLWLILIITIYLLAALYQLELPGLHYDEAFEVIPTLQLLTNQPVTAFRESTLPLFGRQFPLTTQDYIGAINTYGTLPFLALGGLTVWSLRLYTVTLGVLTLILVCRFSQSLNRNAVAGLVAAALLAVNPTFIFWTRQGIFVTSVTATIGIAAAWSWLLWWRTRHYRFAWLGMFLFGLGLYAKLLFIWLLGALLLAWLLIHIFIQRKSVNLLITCLTQFSLMQLGGLILASGLGCWPLLLYNLQTGGTFINITTHAGTSYYGVDNTAVGTNLQERFEQLWVFLQSGQFLYLGDVYTNKITATLFSLACLGSLWLAWRYRQGAILLPYLVIGLIISASIVTVSDLWITHFAVMMTWPAIALATTGVQIWRIYRYSTLTSYSIQKMDINFLGIDKHRFITIFLMTCLLILFLSEGFITWRYHKALTQSGGLSDHSDAIYDLADWLKRHAHGPIVAMDWGMSAQVTFLSAGQLQPIETFGYDWDETKQFVQIMPPYLNDRTFFLWRTPDEIVFDRSAAFQKLYQPLDLEEDIREAFYERSGRPFFGVTQLVQIGEAQNKP